MGPTPCLTTGYWYTLGQRQSLSSVVFPQVSASGTYGQFQNIVTQPWLNTMDNKTKQKP